MFHLRSSLHDEPDHRVDKAWAFSPDIITQYGAVLTGQDLKDLFYDFLNVPLQSNENNLIFIRGRFDSGSPEPGPYIATLRPVDGELILWPQVWKKTQPMYPGYVSIETTSDDNIVTSDVPFEFKPSNLYGFHYAFVANLYKATAEDLKNGIFDVLNKLALPSDAKNWREYRALLEKDDSIAYSNIRVADPDAPRMCITTNLRLFEDDPQKTETSIKIRVEHAGLPEDVEVCLYSNDGRIQMPLTKLLDTEREIGVTVSLPSTYSAVLSLNIFCPPESEEITCYSWVSLQALVAVSGGEGILLGAETIIFHTERTQNATIFNQNSRIGLEEFGDYNLMDDESELGYTEDEDDYGYDTDVQLSELERAVAEYYGEQEDDLPKTLEEDYGDEEAEEEEVDEEEGVEEGIDDEEFDDGLEVEGQEELEDEGDENDKEEEEDENENEYIYEDEGVYENEDEEEDEEQEDKEDAEQPGEDESGYEYTFGDEEPGEENVYDANDLEKDKGDLTLPETGEIPPSYWRQQPVEGASLVGTSMRTRVVRRPAVRTPARPTASGRAPARPTASGRAPARPAASGRAPARPAARGKAPVRPAARGRAPVRPTARGRAPVRPAARGRTPARPAARGRTPARPAGRTPAAAGKTPARPTGRNPDPKVPKVVTMPDVLEAASFVEGLAAKLPAGRDRKTKAAITEARRKTKAATQLARKALQVPTSTTPKDVLDGAAAALQSWFDARLAADIATQNARGKGNEALATSNVVVAIDKLTPWVKHVRTLAFAVYSADQQKPIEGKPIGPNQIRVPDILVKPKPKVEDPKPKPKVEDPKPKPKVEDPKPKPKVDDPKPKVDDPYSGRGVPPWLVNSGVQQNPVNGWWFRELVSDQNKFPRALIYDTSCDIQPVGPTRPANIEQTLANSNDDYSMTHPPNLQPGQPNFVYVRGFCTYKVQIVQCCLYLIPSTLLLQPDQYNNYTVKGDNKGDPRALRNGSAQFPNQLVVFSQPFNITQEPPVKDLENYYLLAEIRMPTPNDKSPSWPHEELLLKKPSWWDFLKWRASQPRAIFRNVHYRKVNQAPNNAMVMYPLHIPSNSGNPTTVFRVTASVDAADSKSSWKMRSDGDPDFIKNSTGSGTSITCTFTGVPASGHTCNVTVEWFADPQHPPDPKRTLTFSVQAFATRNGVTTSLKLAGVSNRSVTSGTVNPLVVGSDHPSNWVSKRGHRPAIVSKALQTNVGGDTVMVGSKTICYSW